MSKKRGMKSFTTLKWYTFNYFADNFPATQKSTSTLAAILVNAWFSLNCFVCLFAGYADMVSHLSHMGAIEHLY